MSFKPVTSQVDFVELEHHVMDWWAKEQIVDKYLHRNDEADSKFSFLDGPITANNPMGVHHAWGRTYKDVFQRYHNMLGQKQRFQNGFDEQGLWVEVEVEKELGHQSKKDILDMVPGDEFASLEKFINLCKERVAKYSAVQTEQSKRLGYFMDWDHSYHTSSAENNYWIWHFLKVCNDKGWIYKGHDSVPWCPRCGTAISQMEILTEDYKEVVHESVFFKLPIKEERELTVNRLPTGQAGQPSTVNQAASLLVWTTTPWTIPANVAVAVNPEFEYVLVETDKGNVWLGKEANERLKLGDPVRTVKGAELVGQKYTAAFDDLPAVESARNEHPDTFHTVVPAKDLVVEGEGTGLVHIAPGAGSEDFKIGKEQNLSVIAPIGESAEYVEGFGFLTGKNAKKHPELIIDYLKAFDRGSFMFKTERYKHRYPICWRCKTELVWRVVDEWYIAVDMPDELGKTYREQMVEVAKSINWLPTWGLDRELDWLKNLGDWLISKKRFWGLALPIYEDTDGSFIVVGSFDELKQLAVEGIEAVEQNSPHRPWIDQVKIKSPKTGTILTRIPDVGNPWLDAGIVPFSTMPKEWFPADFITESFPGQFKNWFYALIAMSTVLKNERPETLPYRPFDTVLGFGTVRDEKGQEMHKSKGNSIEFNAAAETVGAEAMRWQYVTANPEQNLNFGFGPAKEIQRRFFLIWWNVYNFFVTYANLDAWEFQGSEDARLQDTQETINDKRQTTNVLDQWILSKLNGLIELSTNSLNKYDSMTASRALEQFVVTDLSQWYIRRSRDRVGPSADNEADKQAFYQTTYQVLTTILRLGAPYLPFLTEAIYTNLVDSSVHLSDWPVAGSRNIALEQEMTMARQIVEVGHSTREAQQLKLKQPLAKVYYSGTPKFSKEVENLVAKELNVLTLEYEESGSSNEVTTDKESSEKSAKEGISTSAGLIDLVRPSVRFDTILTDELRDMGKAREIIRSIQAERKKIGVKLDDKIVVTLPEWPESQENEIKRQTLAVELKKGDSIEIAKVSS